MKAKILIIDDELGVRESLLELLRVEGYQADAVDSGQLALQNLEEEEYDLALLDLRMPDLDGVEVMHEIKKYHPKTHIIIITGYGSLKSAIEAIRSGADDYLLKPYTSEDVLNSIGNALSEKETKTRKEILIEQLATSLEQLKDMEGIHSQELPPRRVVNLPGGIMVDLERREMWRGNDRVHLTPTESNLLGLFLENQGRVLTHGELVFLVQGVKVEEDQAPEILRPMVSRLRKKMAAFPGMEEWVSNVRGTGYLFEPS
jgi:DNA-binding response OmpR family regulator